MIAGRRVRDLQRLSPGVLARRPAARCTRRCSRSPTSTRTPAAASTSSPRRRRRWPTLLAHVLGFDGGIGSRSEVVDGVYTGRAGGPFTYREGKAQAMRELAAARGHRPRALVGLLRLRVRPADAARRRPPGRGQPRRGARAGRPRRGLGRHALRAPSGGAEGRRPRSSSPRSSATAGRSARAPRRRRAASRPPGARRCADEPPRADRRPARDPRARAALRRRGGRAARRRRGIASTASPREVLAASRRARADGRLRAARPTAAPGADFLSYCLVLEELSRADAGLGVTVAVHTSAGTLPILQHGTPEQIDRLVPPLAQGHEIAAFALTESGLGLGRRRDAHARRRRGPHHRDEAVDHERLARPRRSSSSPATASARARSSCGAARRASASRARRRSSA